MANNFSIKIEGINKVANFLNTKKVVVDKSVQAGLEQAGLFMEGEVIESIAGHRQEPTSVDTGNFIHSVKHNTSEDATVISSPINYAQYLEHGTSKLPARHHFENSLKRNKDKIIKILQTKIKQSI